MVHRSNIDRPEGNPEIITEKRLEALEGSLEINGLFQNVSFSSSVYQKQKLHQIGWEDGQPELNKEGETTNKLLLWD